MRSYVLRIGSPAFSLAADPGSFALTGQAATLRPARRVAASGGSVSITGTAATLTYGGGGASPSFEETWQSYTSLPNNDSAPGIHWASNASIQTGTLFDGSTGKYVRCQYAGSGGDSQATVQLRPSNIATVKAREIWCEVYVLFPSDWSILSDDKSLFEMEDWSDVVSDPGEGSEGAGQGEVWRWAIYLRNNSGYGGPYWRLNTFTNGGSVTSFFNGQWTRLRYHFKMASNSSATDGTYEVWLNDTKIDNQQNIQTDSAPAAYFGTWVGGANADPLGIGRRNWGRYRRYISNPGW